MNIRINDVKIESDISLKSFCDCCGKELIYNLSCNDSYLKLEQLKCDCKKGNFVCPECHGEGTIIDNTASSGIRLCQVCSGAKLFFPELKGDSKSEIDTI